MKKIITILAAAIVLTCPIMAKSDGLPQAETMQLNSTLISRARLKEGELFIGARKRLVKLGWKPIRMHAKDHYEYDGAERRLIERHFHEVDSCSVDAGANCVLYYSQKGQCLRVDTIGEQVHEMKVTRWTQECPVQLN